MILTGRAAMLRPVHSQILLFQDTFLNEERMCPYAPACTILNVRSLPRLTCGGGIPLAQTFDATRGADVIPQSRGDAVVIGLPFVTVTDELLGPNACLTGFRAVTDQVPGAQFYKRLVQVSEQVFMMPARDIDASASGKVFDGSVGGKVVSRQMRRCLCQPDLSGRAGLSVW
jgi:hypothetical protein